MCIANYSILFPNHLRCIVCACREIVEQIVGASVSVFRKKITAGPSMVRNLSRSISSPLYRQFFPSDYSWCQYTLVVYFGLYAWLLLDWKRFKYNWKGNGRQNNPPKIATMGAGKAVVGNTPRLPFADLTLVTLNLKEYARRLPGMP